MRLRSASSLKTSKVANNEVIYVKGETETNSEHGTKIVYTRRRKKGKPVRDVIGSVISSLPSYLSDIPRRPRTKKKKFKAEEALPRPKLDSGVFDNNLVKIWNSFSEDKRKPFAYFDSLWFSLYRAASSKDKVLTWIKKEHIFSKAYVFVPIVCWGHWSLLIFCHFGESLQSTTRSRCMLLLDSLEMVNPRRLEPDIRRFVVDIYKAWDRPETKNLIYQIPLLVPKVPQQRDGNECGNFVLYFINLFLRCAPENFSMGGYPYFMKKDWFTFEDFDRFCERLYSLN
ncbi:probable ubiquitin-like-specific protease 2A [Lotus japonicus]|uniref:Ubiquitin-like protease family profile domain-containing protein n=1 Tax=Lotus japonicus TaxID=34305 RepID=I3SBV8_LOTJA|nr:probable ubiquitin-like-specific protease 2A [Lotus japonicus]AFK37750.1 unknown [Lotus japonicus]